MENTSSVNPKEKTFVMLKPDGPQRGKIGFVIQKFEKKGYKLR